VWPFQRKTEAPVDSGSRPAPAPVIRRDWSGLPPIQRLIGAHPLTAPSDRFSNDLATHHDPSVSTEPMGHQVSAEAPAGIVLALARPTTRNDGPAMISRPRVQRRAQSATGESGEWDGDEAAPPATWPSPLPTGAPPSAARELPVVATAPVAQRLTTLSADSEPMPVETTPQRTRREAIPDDSAASRADAPSEPVAPPRLTLGQARRLGLGPPISRVPDRAVQRATAEAAAMRLAPDPPPPTSSATGDEQPSRTQTGVPSPVEMSAQRLELPLAPRPTAPTPYSDPSTEAQRPVPNDAPVQRAIEISDEPHTDGPTNTVADVSGPQKTEPSEQLPLRPIVQRLTQVDAAPQKGMEFSAVDSPALPLVQRTPQRDSPPQAGRESPMASTLHSPPRGDVGLWASPARGGGVALAPLVGARPLRPTTLQRSTPPGRVDLQESLSDSVDNDPTDERADPTVQRTVFAEASGPEPSAPGDDHRNWSSNGSLASLPTRSPSSLELTHLPQQPRYGRSFQVQTTSEALVGRGAELPLAPLQRAAAQATPEAMEPGSGPTVDVVQRLGPGAASAVASAPTQGPSPAEVGSGSVLAGHTAPGTDIDELAGKLYDKIRTRLKSELLVDRERAGFLTDLR
jgi:hypothetical protein